MLYADKAALENRTKVRLLAIRERELELYVNNCRTMGMVSAIFSGLGFFGTRPPRPARAPAWRDQRSGGGGGWVRAVGLVYTKLDYFKDANCGWHSHQAPEWSECPVGEAMVGGGCQACGDEAPCDSSDCETGTTYSAAIGACVPCGGEYRQALFVAANLLTMCCGLEAAFGTTAITMLGPGLALRGPDGSMHRAVDGLMLEYRLTFLFFTAGLVMFHISALLFAWLEFSWPVALAMTLALLMFIYGMYRYWLRIYTRFALSSDRMITGKFEFGGGAAAAGATRDAGAGASGSVPLSDLLQGGVASHSATTSADKYLTRTGEARKIIDVVEPQPSLRAGARPPPEGGGGGGGYGQQQQQQKEQCVVS